MPLPAIIGLIPVFQSALGVIGAFKGTAAQAKASGYVQDAIAVVTSLTPLVQSFGNGQEVTPEQVKEALAGKDAAIEEFDALIAEKSK